MTAYFVIGGNDSKDARNAARDAFAGLITYYNSLDSTQDKSAIDNYLYGLGLVYRRTTTPTPRPPAKDDFDEAIEDEDVETAGDLLEESAGKAETEKEAKEVLDNTVTLIGSADKKMSDKPEQIEKDLVKLAQTVTTAGKVIDKIIDPAAAQEKAAGIIKSLGDINKKAKEKGAETTSLERTAEVLAQKIVTKAGASTSKAVKDDKKASADLSSVDLSNQNAKAKAAANSMEAVLKDNGLNIIKQKVATVTTLNVETEEDAEGIDLVLPNLEETFETVDKVVVSSGVASFELTKKTIETKSDDEYEENINLNARKLTETEMVQLRSELPQGQVIPEGAQVINLTASVKRVNRETGEVLSTTAVTSFSERIKVSVPYKLKENENPNEVSVFLVKDDGTIKKVGGVYNSETKQIEFYRTNFSNYYAAPSRVEFADITDEIGKMYKDAVEILAGKGLIAGRSKDVYDPDALVTRAEFISLIARMLELEADPADLPFADVNNETAWYRNHLAGAHSAGIISGTSATTFHPSNDITRQEAAAILINAARYLGYNDADGILISTRYTDYDAIAPWAVRSVATVHRDGLADEMYVGKFKPYTKVTRAETAVFIYNMLFKY